MAGNVIVLASGETERRALPVGSCAPGTEEKTCCFTS